MRQKKGAAPGTVDQDLGKVKAMINRAYDNDMISGRTHKVFRKIKKTLKKGADVRDRILSPDEFKALMAHAEGHTRNLIAIGYYTGMRKGEILSLTWGKVDLKNRIIKLEAGDTKDREARTIPICNELFKILQGMPNRIQASGKDNHVIQFQGNPIRDIRDGLRKACKEAKITYGRFEPDGFIFHDLRHTFNTNMRKAGVPESVIMAITGHSTREMFDRYNTIDGEDTRKAVDQYEAFIANVDYSVDQGSQVESEQDENRVSNPHQ
jgi:integrase